MFLSFVKKLDSIDQLLYLICFLSGITFELSQLFEFTYRFSFIIKITPMLCLIMLTIKHLHGSSRVLFTIGLLFCTVGDLLLDIDRINNFMFALIVYLIGHILYISVFHKDIKYNNKYLIPIIFVIVYTIILGILLRNITFSLLIPVIIYLLVIAIMVISSFLVKDGNWVIWSGAALFMVSDTVIAINKFLIPIPRSTFFNIGLYYIAQILIVTGLLICMGKKLKTTISIPQNYI